MLSLKLRTSFEFYFILIQNVTENVAEVLIVYCTLFYNWNLPSYGIYLAILLSLLYAPCMFVIKIILYTSICFHWFKSLINLSCTLTYLTKIEIRRDKIKMLKCTRKRAIIACKIYGPRFLFFEGPWVWKKVKEFQ